MRSNNLQDCLTRWVTVKKSTADRDCLSKRLANRAAQVKQHYWRKKPKQ